MGKELTLDVVRALMRPNQRATVDEFTVLEVQRLAEDPAYGEEFLNSYIDHLNIFKENPGRSHQQYLCAIKFFSLVEADNSLTDAYIKVFPERYNDRKESALPDEDGSIPGKEIMRSEASRYNKSKLVSEIRKVAEIPVQLIYRHLLHEAILVQATLMNTARSEMVKQKASACLIEQLKPSEESVLNVKVEDNTTSVIDELHKASMALAIEQKKSIDAGIPLKVISATRLQGTEEIPVQAEFIDD